MAGKETNVIECKVLFYIDHLKRLGLDFNGLGISVDNVEKPKSNVVVIEYSGNIGKKNFTFDIVQ